MSYDEHKEARLELAEARAEIKRLRAGESDEPYEEAAIPTPGQWIKLWNEATPEKRLKVVQTIQIDGEAAHRCWRMAHDAVQQRAEAAEAEVRSLRSALERTEQNFRLAIEGKPVRDMAENLAENAAALSPSEGGRP